MIAEGTITVDRGGMKSFSRDVAIQHTHIERFLFKQKGEKGLCFLFFLGSFFGFVGEGQHDGGGSHYCGSGEG